MVTAITPQQAREVYAEADLLHSAETVEKALDRMAEAITVQLADRDPLVLCVMIGGLIMAGKLLTRLDFPLQIDYLHATRYAKSTTGGELTWYARPKSDIRDRVVLLVDDIFDEGTTLEAIYKDCDEQGANEIYTAVLLDKLHQRKSNIRPDFTGLTVEDRYVFGYGMDYKGYLRNAQGIYAVNEDA